MKHFAVRENAARITMHTIVLAKMQELVDAICKSIVGFTRQPDDEFTVSRYVLFAIANHDVLESVKFDVLPFDYRKRIVVQRLERKCGTLIHSSIIQHLCNSKDTLRTVLGVTGPKLLWKASSFFGFHQLSCQLNIPLKLPHISITIVQQFYPQIGKPLEFLDESFVTKLLDLLEDGRSPVAHRAGKGHPLWVS